MTTAQNRLQKFLQKAETFVLNIIQDRHLSYFTPLIKGTLVLPSLAFRSLVAIRNWAFDCHYLASSPHPGPLVISIGNIVAGGTGKTPLTLLLSQSLLEDGPIAILSRGYRSQAEHLSFPLMLSTGNGPLYPASYCGDEPYLLAHNLPQAIVIVGKDRQAAAIIAAKAGAKAILIDDGMQHRKLPRDFEVVVINGRDPFGQGYFLPRGLLRDSPKSLKRAHLVIINHLKDEAQYCRIQEQLAPYTKAPIVGTEIKIAGIRTSQNGSISSLKGKKVGIFCGIGQPESFYETVQSLEAEIVACQYLRDHDAFEKYHLTLFERKCRDAGAELIICTEKDFVKISKSMQTSLPIAWVQISLGISAGLNHWTDFIAKVKSSL